MKITKLHCDTCGRYPAMEFVYEKEPYMDGAGARDYHHHSWDLCHECAINILSKHLLGNDVLIKYFKKSKAWQPG